MSAQVLAVISSIIIHFQILQLNSLIPTQVTLQHQRFSNHSPSIYTFVHLPTSTTQRKSAEMADTVGDSGSELQDGVHADVPNLLNIDNLRISISTQTNEVRTLS